MSSRRGETLGFEVVAPGTTWYHPCESDGRRGWDTDTNHINQAFLMHQIKEEILIEKIVNEKGNAAKSCQRAKSKRALGPFRSTGVAPNAFLQC